MEPRSPVLGHVEREHGGDGFPEAPAGGEISDSQPDVIDRWLCPFPEAGARLDAVAVGIEDEAAVVARVVLRPQARLAVARVARIDAAPPESVDVLPRRSREGEVEVASDRMLLIRLREGEVVPLVEPVSPARRSAEHGLVEAPGSRPVGDADRHVVEHQSRSIASPNE
jgi:hypothetical protein